MSLICFLPVFLPIESLNPIQDMCVTDEVSDFSAAGYSDDGDSSGSGAADHLGSGSHAQAGDPGSGGNGFDPALTGGECATAAAGSGSWRGGGLSFTGKGCHESVRVVIPDRGAFPFVVLAVCIKSLGPSRVFHPECCYLHFNPLHMQ